MSDPNQPFTIDQKIFKAPCPAINVFPCHENGLTKLILRRFLDSDTDGIIGVAPAYGSHCKLARIAFATRSNVLLVRLSSSKPTKSKRRNSPQNTVTGRELLSSDVFCDTALSKCAFKMDKLATSLFLDLDLRITLGVDLLSTSTSDRHEFETLLTTLGGETILRRQEVAQIFRQQESAKASDKDTALQAWAAHRAGMPPVTSVNRIKQQRIDTTLLATTHLAALAKIHRDANRLDALKPVTLRNDVKPKISYNKHGDCMVQSDRYKTRVRPSLNQIIKVHATNGGKTIVATGRATQVLGRAATLQLNKQLNGEVRSIVTRGKENLTYAEKRRETVILDALRLSNDLCKNSFFKLIWLPNEKPGWLGVSPPARRKAVQAVFSMADAHKFVLVQGPPGTGKTSVIACATQCLMDARHAVWLIAHSNVAVKNIAEKLANEDLYTFKLLVAHEFHFDWHEHLYEKIERNVIRSDQFPRDGPADRLLAGSRVILCTLSMLSHPQLAAFTRTVPIEIVIVDEASQIEIGEYIPIIHLHGRTIKKLAFIGDDKQLPPHGQGDLHDLQSIFEVSHLRKHSLFLDIQYRMPVQLGRFISKHVYNEQLQTTHSITSDDCLRFIDCKEGKESKNEHSYQNIHEVQVVAALARQYSSRGVSFRIITPYDAQRSAIENTLKAEKLPWENKCFNVDSFQGNEDDHIILSLTRSDKIGFLTELRRTNVMLTRCKRSMDICTSRSFINGPATKSLVADLARSWGGKAWIDSRSIRFGTH